MNLTVKSADTDPVEVALDGSVAQSEFSPFVEPLAKAVGAATYSSRVLLDLSGVSFMDSSGVSWLLSCNRRFREHGGQLVLHTLSPAADRVIRVLKLDGVLRLAPNRAEALQAIGAAQ